MFLEGKDDLKSLFTITRKILTELHVLDKKAKTFIAGEYLDIYNKNLRDKNSSLISKIEFSKYLKLEGILIYISGLKEFCYNDGNLFLGHSLIAKLGDSLDFINVSLFG